MNRTTPSRCPDASRRGGIHRRVLCAWGVGLLVALASTAGSPRVALADSPANAETEETAFSAPVGSGEWNVRFRRDTSAKTPRSTIALRITSDGDAAIETILPGWAGPPKYGLRVEAARIASDTVAVLSTLAPSSGEDSGADGVTLQVAWVGGRDRPGRWSWELVRRTEHSTLDGGRKLAIERSDGAARLVELNPQTATRLCGPGPKSEFDREQYDPDVGRFVRRASVEGLVAEAESLEASLPDEPLSGPFTRGIYQWYWATSSAESSSRTSGVVRPMQLGDRRGGSAWTVDARDGLRGEFATANVADAVPVRALHIVPGFPRSEEAYRAHGRPAELLVTFSGGTKFVVELPDVDYHRLVARRGLLVELPEPIETNCISVLHLSARGVDDAASGDAPSPVSIAEIAPITVLDAPTAGETAERIVDRIAAQPDLRTRRRIAYFASGVHSELDEAVSEALSQTKGLERRRILPLLDQIPAERAVPILIEFFRKLDRDAVEYRAVKRGLAAHGSRSAKPLVELLGEWKPDHPKSIDAVRLVGRVGNPSHLKALAGELGSGDESVRNARIRAVASAGEAVLSRLFSIVAVRGSVPRTRDALTTIYLIGKRRYRDRLGEHPESGALLEVVERSDDRRTLLHAFRAARFFHVEGLVAKVREKYADHSDVLVRKAAVAAVVGSPSSEARSILERALEDRSPDVRIAAISGIRERDDRRESTGVLLNYVHREGWSPGQQQALEVLAEVEVPETQKFFRELLQQRGDSELALRAARVLSRASRPVDASVCREIVVDEEAPRPLRLQMIELLGFDRSQEGEEFLLKLLDRDESRTLVAERGLRAALERRAMMALGQRRSARARSRLLEMAKSGSKTELRRQAVRALGFYRDEEILRELRAWRPDAPPRLRPTIAQSIQMIENRGVIDDMKRRIDETLESETGASERDDSARRNSN